MSRDGNERHPGRQVIGRIPSGGDTGYPRGVLDGCRSWEEFEGRLLKKYGLDDAFRLSKREVMDWVEIPRKGRNASVLLREFEERFTQLSVLDRTMLDASHICCCLSRPWMRGIDIRRVSCWRPMTGSWRIGPWKRESAAAFINGVSGETRGHRRLGVPHRGSLTSPRRCGRKRPGVGLRRAPARAEWPKVLLRERL